MIPIVVLISSQEEKHVVRSYTLGVNAYVLNRLPRIHQRGHGAGCVLADHERKAAQNHYPCHFSADVHHERMIRKHTEEQN